MAEYQRLVDRTRRRIGIMLGLRTAVAVLSGWLLLWGTLVLILRTSLAVPRETLLWGLSGIAVAVMAGIVTGIRRCPSPVTIRALLDESWKAGGLLMASAESNVTGWEVSPPPVAIPRVRWTGSRQWLILGGCALFAATSFLIPSRTLGQLTPQRLQVAAEVEKLAEKVEILKEEKILSPERAQSLEEALEQLQREAAGNDPGKTWEAMDHLEQSLAKAGEEAAEKSEQNARNAAHAEELAAALDQARDRMEPNSLATAMSQLAEEIAKIAEEDADLLQQALAEDLMEQLENGTLSKEQLEELAKKLGECKACNTSRLGKLAAARMIDPSRLSELDGQLRIDPEALAKLLSECQGSKDAKACLACERPGRGGVTRGRGDAAMTWTDGTNRDGLEFKEKALSPGAIASLKDALLQGVSKADPTPQTPQSSQTGGALDARYAGRGSARTQVVLPEHKKVVQRYFDRDPSRPDKGPQTP